MNQLVAYHRSNSPNDPRSDEEITLAIGDQYPGVYDASYPDFGQEYSRLNSDRRRVNAPPMGVEFQRGVSRGVDSLQSTAAGAMSMASQLLGNEGAQEFYADIARKNEAEAAESAPTIRNWSEVERPSDLARYLMGGAGEVLPSVAEAAVTGTVGALAGSTAAPGPGTAGGFITGIIGKQALKSLIKKQVIKGADDLATEAGKKFLKDETKALAAKYGLATATALNSYALSSGEIYNDLSKNKEIDPGDALNISMLGGLVAAVPDTFLPTYVVGKFFPGVASASPEVKKKAYGYFARLAQEIAKNTPLEASTEAFQEAVNIASAKFAKPETRDDAFEFSKWSKDDVERLYSAATLGGLGGFITAPVSAIPSTPQKAEAKPEATANPVLQKYIGEIPAEDQQRLREMAKAEVVKESAGESTVAERSAVQNLSQGERNFYLLAKDEAERGLTESVEAEGETELDKLLKDALTKIKESQPSAEPVKEAGVTATGVPVGEAPSSPPESLEINPASRRKLREDEPPLKRGFVRFYHGGGTGKKPGIDFSPYREYAEGYAKNTAGSPDVWFVDLPEDAPFLTKSFEEFEGGPKSPMINTVVPDEYLGAAKKLGTIQRENLPNAGAQVPVSDASPSESQRPVAPAPISEVVSELPSSQPMETKGGELNQSTAAPSVQQLSEPSASVLAPAIPTIKESLIVQPEAKNILDLADFSHTSPKQLKSGAGVKSNRAAGYVANPTTKQLYEFAKATGGKNSTSNKMAILESPDGQQILATTASKEAVYDKATKKNKLTEAITQGGKAVPIKTLLDSGWKLIGSIKTTEPTNREFITYSREQWDAIQPELAARQQELANFIEPTSLEEIGAVNESGEIEGASGVAVQSGKARAEQEQAVGLAPLKGVKISDSQAEALVRAVGEPNWSDEVEAQESIAAAINANDEANTVLIQLLKDNPNYGSEIWEQVLDRLIKAYEAAEQAQAGEDKITQTISIVSGRLQPAQETRSNNQSSASATRANAGGKAAVATGAKGATRTGTGEEKLRNPTGAVNATPLEPSAMAMFQGVIQRLANAGVDVDLIQQGLAGLDAKFGGSYGAQQGRRFVQLVLGDLTNPTQESLTSLLHETVHALFAGESIERQQQILAAISQATDTQLDLVSSPDSRIRESNPSGLTQDVLNEERLAEWLARSGAFSTNEESLSVAQKIVRFLREIYLSAAMVLQEMLFGSASENLALGYFEAKARGFFDPRGSFISWIGGGKPTDAGKVRMFTPASGLNDYPAVWNGYQMVSDSVLPESKEAIALNMRLAAAQRYRKLGDVMSPNEATPDTLPEIKSADFTAQNAVEDSLNSVYQAWTAAGHNRTSTGQPLISPDQFAYWALPNNMDAPKDVIQAGNDQLQRLGQAALNPNIRITDLNEFAQKQGASKGLAMLQKIRAHWGEKRSKAEIETDGTKSGSLQSKFNREADRITRLVKHQTNAELFLNDARSRLATLLQDLKDDAKDIRGLAGKTGALSQAISSVMERGESSRQYVAAINNLANRLGGVDGIRFMDTLEAVAQLPIDWRTMSVTDIRQIIKSAARQNPLLSPLIDPTVDSRALMSVAIAFGKSDNLVNGLLALRRADMQGERDLLNQALKTAISDHTDNINEARKILKKMPRFAAKAEIIINALEKAMAEQRSRLSELESHRQFIDFHNDSIPSMRNSMAQLERVLGAQDLIFEPYDGVKYIVPSSPGDSAEFVESNSKQFRVQRDKKAQAALHEDLRKMQAWLDAHPDGDPLHQGSTYTRLQQQIEKIRLNEMDSEVYDARRSTTIRVLGSMTDRLRQTGHPAALKIARRINDLTHLLHIHKSDMDRLSTDFANAERKAMQAVGYKMQRFANFKEEFYDRPLEYIAQRKDILLASKDIKQAQDEALRAVRSYLLSDPDTASRVNQPGAWQALEEYYRTTARVSDELMKMSEKMGIKIQGEGVFRNTKGAPLFETLRSVSSEVKLLHQKMRDLGWLNFISSFNRDELTDTYNNDPNQLRAMLAPLFSQDVWKDFLGPIARKIRSEFYAPADAGGFQNIAQAENVKKAYEMANGDVVAFAEALYDLSGGTTDKGEFVAETLDTLKNYFGAIHGMYQKEATVQDYNIEPLEKYLMNGRVAETFPSEWLDYRRYDAHSVRSIVQHLAFHASMGTDMSGVEEDFNSARSAMQDQLTQLSKIEKETAGIADKKARQAAQETQAKAAGTSLKALTNAARNNDTIQAEHRRLQDYVKAQSGVLLEMRPWAELLNTMVGSVVQAPGTALVDTISMFKPIFEFGLSGTSLGMVKQNLKTFAQENIGSFAEVFGKTLKFNEEYVRRRHALGIYDSDRVMTWKERVNSVLQSAVPMPGENIVDKVGRGVSIASRLARLPLQTGISVKKSEDPQFFTFKPQAIFTQVGQTMNAAVIDGVWRAYEDMVTRAAEYLNLHPSIAADPNLKLTGDQLGYTSKFGGLLNDNQSFEYMRAKMEEYGLSLESLGRDLAQRMTVQPNVPVMSDSAYQKLSTLATSELLAESSLSTRPSALMTNPVLKFAVPLMGWSINQSAQVAKMFSGPKGEANKAAFKKGLVAIAAMAGVSLAYASLREKYDEEVLDKKANVLGFGNNIPLAFIDRMARVGQLGITGDFVNSFLNQSTAREFSVDSRVFAVNTLNNLRQTIGSWIRQGDADYTTVVRPLMQSVGGSGYLQYGQIINNLFDLDNAESRATARINASNWLRVAGRELNLDVNSGRGSGASASLSTPIKPHIMRMALAAYANDASTFLQAYQSAKQQRISEGNSPEEAEKSVRQSFAYQNPLRTVFKTAPTDVQFQMLLNTLPENGRRDVEEAVRLMNYYLERIGGKPFDGKEVKKPSSPFGRNDFRSRSVSLLGRESLFAR